MVTAITTAVDIGKAIDEIDVPGAAGVANEGRGRPKEECLRIGEPAGVNSGGGAWLYNALQFANSGQAPVVEATQALRIDAVFKAHTVGRRNNVGLGGRDPNSTIKFLHQRSAVVVGVGFVPIAQSAICGFDFPHQAGNVVPHTAIRVHPICNAAEGCHGYRSAPACCSTQTRAGHSVGRSGDQGGRGEGAGRARDSATR